MKSTTIELYRKSGKLDGLTEAQITFVDEVYAHCEQHYDAGGDVVVECYEPAEIIQTFQSLADVAQVVRVRISRELDARWGDDSDPELARAKRCDEAKWEE